MKKRFLLSIGIAGALVSHRAGATIHYREVNFFLLPQGSGPYQDGAYKLDIDQDGFDDVEFNVHKETTAPESNSCTANIPASQPVGGILIANDKVVALTAGQSTTQPTYTYGTRSTTNFLLADAKGSGQFYGAGLRYTMIRFESSGHTYHAWVLLEAAPNGSPLVHVVSCAWNDVPDQLLQPGQANGIAAPETAANALRVGLSVSSLSIAGAPAGQDLGIVLTDMSGRTVLRCRQSGDGQIPVFLTPGTYLVLVADQRRQQRLFSAPLQVH